MQNIIATVLPFNRFLTLTLTDTNRTAIWNHMSEALYLSLNRILSLLIAVLPGIFAMFISLAIFTLIGMAVSALLRRGLTLVKFDDRLVRNRSNAGWIPPHSPTALAARISFWSCVLIGLIVGVSAFGASFAAGSELPVSMLAYLTHTVGGIILLIAGTLVARFMARSVLIGAVNAQLQYARFLSLGIKWLVLVLTAAMVLDHLQVGGNIVELAFGILFGGIVLTLSLAIGLGSRDLVSRTLESHVEHSGEHETTSHNFPNAGQDDSIRHF
jgi:hypothetical protein